MEAKKNFMQQTVKGQLPVSSPVCQLGISIRDLDLLTIGMVNDMFVESRNDEYKG